MLFVLTLSVTFGPVPLAIDELIAHSAVIINKSDAMTINDL